MKRSLFVLGLLLSTSPAWAFPRELVHQGRMFDSNGDPLQGPQNLEFKLFDSATAGTELWSQAYVGHSFDDGYFTVTLGTDAGSPLQDDWFLDNETLFVEVVVNGAPLGSRIQLKAAPYAIVAGRVEGGTVDAAEVQVNGTTVIDGDGNIDYSHIVGAPADQDTVGALLCSVDEVARFDGSSWGCAAANAHAHDAGQLATGTLDILRLPVGGSAGTVAAGDHLHTAADVTTGVFDINRVPVGTGVDQVAAGDHGHTAADVGAVPATGGSYSGDVDVTGALSATGGVSVGDTSANCDSSLVGTLRYVPDTGLDVCTEAGWTAIVGPVPDGSSADDAGASCAQLLSDHPGSPSGVYWVDPNGGSTADAQRAYCDMVTDGGGWTLLMRIHAGDDVQGAGYSDAMWTNSAEIGAVPTGTGDLATRALYGSPLRGSMAIDRFVVRDETDPSNRVTRRTIWSDLRTTYAGRTFMQWMATPQDATNKDCTHVNRIDDPASPADGRWAMFQEGTGGTQTDANAWGLFVNIGNTGSRWGRVNAHNCLSTNVTEWPGFGAASSDHECNFAGVTQGGYTQRRDMAFDATAVARHRCADGLIQPTVWTFWAK